MGIWEVKLAKQKKWSILENIRRWLITWQPVLIPSPPTSCLLTVLWFLPQVFLLVWISLYLSVTLSSLISGREVPAKGFQKKGWPGLFPLCLPHSHPWHNISNSSFSAWEELSSLYLQFPPIPWPHKSSEKQRGSRRRGCSLLSKHCPWSTPPCSSGRWLWLIAPAYGLVEDPPRASGPRGFEKQNHRREGAMK